MKFYPTASFVRCYKKIPLEIQRKVDKAIKLLLKELHYPSLRAKKYDEERNIWQARVNRNYRFYFLIKGDTYILLEIKPHPK